MSGLIAPYDVRLNGKKYLVVPGTYHEAAAPDVITPYRTTGGDPESRSNEDPAWVFWSQTYWRGDSVDDWKTDVGGFYRAYGVDLSRDGELGSAQTFTLKQADATNTDGYLLIPFSNTLAIAIGKTTSNVWTSPDLNTWTSRGYAQGTGTTKANAWCFYKGTLIVSFSDGTLRTTTDGITWSTYPALTPPSANSAYVLGVYRSKLYVAWAGDLRTWNGTTLTALVTLDGTPVCGAVGAGSMFILAQGTPAHLYMASGDQLVELLQWPSDFQPDDAVYTDTLYISGGAIAASGGNTGEIWRYSEQGIEQMYDYPQLHGAGVDYRIRSLAASGMTLLFSANKLAGVGTYDSTYDLWMDSILGFGIGSRTTAFRAGAGQVIGILPWRGSTCIGVVGEGLFTTGGFCDFQLTSSLFGSASKRISKLWGLCELTFAQLQVGQSIQVEYSTNGVTFTVLGTVSYDAADATKTKAYLPFPAQLLSPVMQYRVTGTANNSDLSILDVSFSFINASQNPKRRWSFVIGIDGSSLEPMSYRDGSPFDRSGPAMKTELDALWNKRFTFEDLFGKPYTVTMPAPSISVNDIVKELNAGDETTVDSVLANYRTTLVEM